MKKFAFPLLALALCACGAKANDQTDTVEVAEVAVAQELQPAPDFTLEGLDGKQVSLSDFRGKWVILDFWGSWCPWCIKGFPALKEAYKDYAGKVEVIGIDCGDSKETWKDAVKTHALPWVQVYNPQDSDLTDVYGIQGFPTKFIIDPQGNVANCTVGEDPEFFNVLKVLVK